MTHGSIEPQFLGREIVKIDKKKQFVLILSILIFLTAAITHAGNKKLMTINAAKVVAERAIAESVVGLKIRSEDTVENLVTMHMKIESKVFAAIKGVNYTDIVYDKEKDIAKVTAEMDVNRVQNIVGGDIYYGNMIMQRVGFATSTPARAKSLQALRAAELDAYKQLAKQIIGFKIGSKSSVENYILKSDSIKAKVLAAIWGAELTGYRWDSDGDAYVTLQLRTGLIEDVMGQQIDYQGDVIEVEGVGAQNDDYSQKPQTSGSTGTFTKVGTEVREGSLNVPVSALTDGGKNIVGGGGGTQLQP